MKLRWYLDLAIVDRVIVGRVYQLAVEGAAGRGQIRQVGRWVAVGMKAEWSDTPLGEEHGTRNDAMLAVVNWYVELPKAITEPPL